MKRSPHMIQLATLVFGLTTLVPQSAWAVCQHMSEPLTSTKVVQIVGIWLLIAIGVMYRLCYRDNQIISQQEQADSEDSSLWDEELALDASDSAKLQEELAYEQDAIEKMNIKKPGTARETAGCASS